MGEQSELEVGFAEGSEKEAECCVGQATKKKNGYGCRQRGGAIIVANGTLILTSSWATTETARFGLSASMSLGATYIVRVDRSGECHQKEASIRRASFELRRSSDQRFLSEASRSWSFNGDTL